MAKLAPKATVFTREELFDEYKSKVMYGFLEGICLFSNVYESQLKKHEADRERHHRYLTKVTRKIGVGQISYFKAIWRRIRWRPGGATLLGLSGRSGRHGGGCRESQISGEAAQDQEIGQRPRYCKPTKRRANGQIRRKPDETTRPLLAIALQISLKLRSHDK